MKTCSRCGHDLPEGAFTRDASQRDGRFPWCRMCLNTYKRARLRKPKHRRKARRDWREWRRRNPTTKQPEA